MPAAQTHPTGASSPREALGQCHRCIADMLARLEGLVSELARAPAAPPPELADRARQLVAELDEALGVHMVDEECDVFPAVLAASQSPARHAQAFELVSSLLVEHRELSELWHALRVALLALGGGMAVAFPAGTAADFLVRVRSHLEREEVELAEILGTIGPARSGEIVASIAHRHDVACPRVRNCPLKR
jgi:hemerythrin-like domain-containing protein